VDLSVSRIKENISKLRKSSTNINSLFDQLDSFGVYLLIGGAVRDLLFNSNPRDYDIVVDTEEELILNLPDIKRNSFGGLKIKLNQIEFDIWTLNKTWAFRKMNVRGSIKNLQNSCFFNLDSIIYDFKKEELLCDHFYRGISSRTLDIIFEENPYPSVCVIRAFVLRDKWELDFSKRLNDFIYNWYLETNDPIESLIDAQEKHYKEIILNKNKIIYNLKKIITEIEGKAFCYG
jgi:hypothetical protein